MRNEHLIFLFLNQTYVVSTQKNSLYTSCSIVFLLLYGYLRFVSLPHGAMSWSVASSVAFLNYAHLVFYFIPWHVIILFYNLSKPFNLFYIS